jgi:hypothetical protein
MKGASFVRAAGVSTIAGGILQLVLGTFQWLHPVWPPSVEFSIRNDAIVLSHALVLVGIIGLAASGAAGAGWLARIGLAVAIGGGTLFMPSEYLIQSNVELGSNLDGMCASLIGLGLLAGIAVLREQRWRSWHRLMPLATGLYVFAVIFPVFAITHGPNFLALGGWGSPVLLMGVSLLAERPVALRAQPAALVASAG